MAGRKTHVSPTRLFFSLLSAAVILLCLPQSLTGKLNLLFQSTFNPLLRIGRTSEHLRRSGGDVVSRQEYDKLWKAYENLHVQMKRLHSDYETLSRVRRALPVPGAGMLLAEVTSVSRGIRHELVLNRGAESGAAVGQYVLSADRDSVLGTVIQTTDKLCRVRLLTDPAQNLEVLIRRPDTGQTIKARLVGDGKDGASIPLMARDLDIRRKDVVYAAAKTGLLEIPVVIGEISEVKGSEQSPLLWEISVELVDNPFLQSRAVILVPPQLPSREDN